ncbi:Suppressor of cytokine signaling 5 [Sarcoptes scabiei]|nr:Suppressor of cytokine signaling 5 [Sarcoptes scabiei]
MDKIKFVIEELNQSPFNENLNLIAYDNLQSEQRLNVLIKILNIIDPKLKLSQIQAGNVEEIISSILEMLRIFEYNPPINDPAQFRKSLILADKDLLTDIFQWILQRLSLLKKRAYLAKFLVKIELSPEVEGDQDVSSLYNQYLNLIEEFKKIHSTYEMQKKSVDSIIELQRDIKSMELEKDQIRGKLEIVKRRINLDSNEPSTLIEQNKLQSVRDLVLAKNENEILERQSAKQLEKIENLRKQIESQQAQLNEINLEYWNESTRSPEVLLFRFKDEIEIKQNLAKDVLPNELSDLRRLTRELENVSNQSDLDSKDKLAKNLAQIQALSNEINELMEKKLLNKQTEDDRLSHYRQNVLIRSTSVSPLFRFVFNFVFFYSLVF